MQWACVALGVLWPLALGRPDLYVFDVFCVAGMLLAIRAPQSYWERRLGPLASRSNVVVTLLCVWLVVAPLMGVLVAASEHA